MHLETSEEFKMLAHGQIRPDHIVLGAAAANNTSQRRFPQHNTFTEIKSEITTAESSHAERAAHSVELGANRVSVNERVTRARTDQTAEHRQRCRLLPNHAFVSTETRAGADSPCQHPAIENRMSVSGEGQEESAHCVQA